MSLHITKANPEQFDKIYSDMQQQFPYIDIKPKSTFLKIMQNTNYDVWLAQSNVRNKWHDIGYMLVWVDTQMQFIWLEYIAVSSKYHGKGYGGKMLKALRAHYGGLRGCFLELEKPTVKNKNSERRIGFYTERGAYKLDFRYFFPQESGDLELDLYFLPFKQEERLKIPDSDILKSIINVYAALHQSMPGALRTLSKIGPIRKNVGKI